MKTFLRATVFASIFTIGLSAAVEADSQAFFNFHAGTDGVGVDISNNPFMPAVIVAPRPVRAVHVPLMPGYYPDYGYRSSRKAAKEYRKAAKHYRKAVQAARDAYFFDGGGWYYDDDDDDWEDYYEDYYKHRKKAIKKAMKHMKHHGKHHGRHHHHHDDD